MAEHLSYLPDDFEQGGLLDDFDGTVVSAEACKWDYEGKADEDSPAIKLEIQPDDAEESITQYWSAGKLARVRPSKDGKHLIPAANSAAKGISKTSNAAMLLASLADAGFAMKLLMKDGFPALEGLYCHFIRVPQPKRSGLPVDPEDEDRQRTVLTVSEIHKGKKSSTKPGKKKATRDTDDEEEEDADEDADDEEEEEEEDGEEESEEGSEVADEADTLIAELLGDKKHSKGISADGLATLVFQAAKAAKSKNTKAIVELVQDDDYLSDKARPFKVVGDTIKARK